MSLSAARPARIATALSNNFAFGGANACLVLRTVDANRPGTVRPQRQPGVITGVAGLTPAGDLDRAWTRIAAGDVAAEVGYLDDAFVELVPARSRRKLDRPGS